MNIACLETGEHRSPLAYASPLRIIPREALSRGVEMKQIHQFAKVSYGKVPDPIVTRFVFGSVLYLKHLFAAAAK